MDTKHSPVLGFLPAGFPTSKRSSFDNCCDFCGHYPEARASKGPTQNRLETTIRLLFSLENSIQQRSRLSKRFSLSHPYPVSLSTWSSQARDQVKQEVSDFWFSLWEVLRQPTYLGKIGPYLLMTRGEHSG